MSDWNSDEALLTEGYRRCAKLTWRYGTTYFWGAALLPKRNQTRTRDLRSAGGDSLMSQEVFSILAVCTGNVCRSPAAERLLASKLGPSVRVSLGGHACAGGPSDLQAYGRATARQRLEPELV